MDNTLRAFSIAYGPSTSMWFVEFDGAPVTWGDDHHTVVSSALPAGLRLMPDQLLGSKDNSASVCYSNGSIIWWCSECDRSTIQNVAPDRACGQPRILVQFCDPVKPCGWIVHVPSFYGCGMHGLLSTVVMRIYNTFHEAHAVLWQCQRRGWSDEAVGEIELQPDIEFQIEPTEGRLFAQRYASATGSPADAMPLRGAMRSKQSKGKVGHHHGQIACPCTDPSNCPVRRLNELYKSNPDMKPSCGICGGPAPFCHPPDDPCWEAVPLFARIGQGTPAAAKPVMFSLCVAAA